MQNYAKLCKIIPQHTKMYKNIPKYIEIQENMQDIQSVVHAIIFNWWNKTLLIIDYICLIRFIKIRTYIKRSVTQFRWKRQIWPLFYVLFQRNVKLGGTKAVKSCKNRYWQQKVIAPTLQVLGRQAKFLLSHVCGCFD